MRDGDFVTSDGSIPQGQEIVKTLLDRCLKWSEIVLERLVEPGFPLYKGNSFLTNDLAREKLMNAFRKHITTWLTFETSSIGYL